MQGRGERESERDVGWVTWIAARGERRWTGKAGCTPVVVHARESRHEGDLG